MEETPEYLISRAIQKSAAITAKYKNIEVSVSGGKDSNVMLDMLLKVCPKDKLRFVFFDTGIEYAATKKHLAFLEEKYDIYIDCVKATIPVPLGVKKYGLPFISKDISGKMNTLQNNHFDFVNDGNKPYEELIALYPHCTTTLKWWCNIKPLHNIKDNRYLKEFIIANPPDFKISARCCEGAKKRPSHAYEKENKFDLKCLGLRKAEGGVRSMKFKNCYTDNSQMQNFRPAWWLTDKAEELYIDTYSLTLSDCYIKYGMKRTGCAGCPFNSRFEEELLTIKTSYEKSSEK